MTGVQTCALPISVEDEESVDANEPDPIEAAKAGLAFEPDELREKYRQERDKRLRADGEAQYLEL